MSEGQGWESPLHWQLVVSEPEQTGRQNSTVEMAPLQRAQLRNVATVMSDLKIKMVTLTPFHF